MLAKLFSPLFAKIFGSALVIAGLALAWQTFQVARLSDKLDTARAERDLAIEQRNHWIAESDRRKATGKRTLEADKPKSEQRTKARDAVQLRDGECETDPEIIDAVEKGWIR